MYERINKPAPIKFIVALTLINLDENPKAPSRHQNPPDLSNNSTLRNILITSKPNFSIHPLLFRKSKRIQFAYILEYEKPNLLTVLTITFSFLHKKLQVNRI